MAGRNDAVLVTSTVLEWQKACIDCVTRKKDYAPLVYRLAPHIGFEHRAISDLRVFALDYYVCHFIGDQTDKVQFAELELPKKVYRQTLQDCMKNSLDIFSHIPLQVWVEAAFNIDGKVLTEFRDYHIRLGRQLQAKEMVVSGEFLAVSSTHPKYSIHTNQT